MSRRGVSAASLTLLLTLAAGPLLLAQSNTAQTIRYGEITALTETVVVDKATGRGAQTGATVGAIAGYALSNGRDRWLGSLLGGALGGAAGHAAEKSSKKRKGWELIIKVEGGEEIGIQVPGKKTKYKVGQRVRLMTGPGGQTKVTPV